MSSNKKPQQKKSSKIDKKEFDEVLNQLNSESKTIEKAALQKGTFASYAFWVAIAALYPYIVGVYETNFTGNVLFFGAGSTVTGLMLYYFYGLIAISKKNSLMQHGGEFSLALGESDSKRKAILKTVANQSCYFSLFIVNFFHLIFYLFSMGYILPIYQLDHPVNYLTGSVLTAVLSFIVLSVVAKVL